MAPVMEDPRLEEEEALESARAAEADWDAAERTMADAQRKRVRRWLGYTVGVVVIMIGFTVANVPLFNMLCQKLGIAQNPNNAESELTEGEAREIEIIYMGNVIGQLPVSFRPVQRIQRARIGEVVVNDYHFVNLTDRKIFFRPVHSIQPAEATKELNLSKCFCFDDQVLMPRQEISLPVAFKIGAGIPKDANHVTLSYTLFELAEKDFKVGQTTFNAKEVAPDAN